MKPLEVVALGRRLPVRLSIPDAGALRGLPKATAYRHAVSERWPVAGPKGSQSVATIPFLECYGIPWAPAEDGR